MVRHDINQFYSPIDSEKVVGLECIDDRGYAIARQSLKIAAGPFGLAKDIQAANFVDLGDDALQMPLGATAKIVAKNLRAYNIDPGTHRECAAELGAIPIADQITDNAEQVHNSAIEIAQADISDATYEQISQYYNRLRTHHYRGAEVEAACMDGDGEHPGITRHGLAHEEHVAPYLVANHMNGTVFDTQSAYSRGVPRYNVDMWAVPRLTREVSTAFPVDPDKVLAATAIRHAAIARLLPNDQSESGQGVNLKIVA